MLELFRIHIAQLQRRKGEKGAMEKEIEETKRRGITQKRTSPTPRKKIIEKTKLKKKKEEKKFKRKNKTLWCSDLDVLKVPKREKLNLSFGVRLMCEKRKKEERY